MTKDERKVYLTECRKIATTYATTDATIASSGGHDRKYNSRRICKAIIFDLLPVEIIEKIVSKAVHDSSDPIVTEKYYEKALKKREERLKLIESKKKLIRKIGFYENLSSNNVISKDHKDEIISKISLMEIELEKIKSKIAVIER